MNNIFEILSLVDGFEWDRGNITKNWERHSVTNSECEDVFFNNSFFVKKDIPDSLKESRYFVLGKTESGRLLFIVFIIRNNKIRVISARDMSRKERKIYEEIEKNSKI